MIKKPRPNRVLKPASGPESMDDFMPQLGGDMAVELAEQAAAARRGKPDKVDVPVQVKGPRR